MNSQSSGSGGGEDSEAPHLDPDRLPANENPHSTQYEHCPPVYPDIESKFDLNDYCYADADYEPSAKQPDPTSCDFSKDSRTSIRSISQLSRQYSAQKQDEIPGANYPMQSHADSSPYNLQHPYYLEVSGVLDRMEISVHQQRDTKKRHHDPNSKYGPYTGQFDSTESASQYRKQATRFDRKPYRPPDTDDTIAEVERNRKYNVERIYNAMTRGDAARDNKGSIAMKRWVHGAYYKADLVEAYSHKVLDCLLLQAKEGFRGWVHNDYVADDRKGEDEDRDFTCEERLESILRALEEEKTICEDVMNSACQIRMFVNAPKAYANRKYQNRVGNSKRGKPKELDASEPAAKIQRVNSRPIARARRRTGSKVITEPDLHAPPQGHAGTVSALQHTDMRFLTPLPYTGRSHFHGTTQYVSHHGQAQVPHHTYANSPLGITSPPVHEHHIMPLPQQIPLGSTPVLSYGHHSAPPSPDYGKALYDLDTGPWSSTHPYEPGFGDALLFDEPWPGRQPEHIRTGPSANLFAARPEAAKEVLSSGQHGPSPDIGFSDYWNQQSNIQSSPNVHEARFEGRHSANRD